MIIPDSIYTIPVYSGIVFASSVVGGWIKSFPRQRDAVLVSVGLVVVYVLLILLSWDEAKTWPKDYSYLYSTVLLLCPLSVFLALVGLEAEVKDVHWTNVLWASIFYLSLVTKLFVMISNGQCT